jgi:hypothetical protein
MPALNELACDGVHTVANMLIQQLFDCARENFRGKEFVPFLKVKTGQFG